MRCSSGAGPVWDKAGFATTAHLPACSPSCFPALSLQYLSKIKVQQIEKDRGEWDSLSPEARREKESSLQMFGQLARFHNIMSNETIGTLAFLTSGRKSKNPCWDLTPRWLWSSGNCCFLFQKLSPCLCTHSSRSASSPCSTTSCNTWLGRKWEL